MPVLLFLHKLHNFHGQTIKSKINKALFMHILIMTLKKLNNVHISVFFSDNACLSLNKIL